MMSNQKKRNVSPIVVVLAVALVVVACSDVGLLAVFLTRVGARASTPPAPTATIQLSQHDLVVAYKALVVNDMSKLTTAMNAVGHACTSGTDATACDTAVQSAEAAAKQLNHDAGAAHPPDCLASANGTLVDGSSALFAALVDIDTGIQASDASLINQGTADMKAAGDKITSAETAIGKAVCP